ncbi:DUF1877 family protein [Asanoa sp. NPDC049518]|uniref:DUF1877 family protein n=1 Tax=unclassified Asanoa TaxID=2685164 RepID=UPI00341ADE8C
MSILGSLVRVSPNLVEELRSPGADPYDVISELDTQIDLDRYWDVLRFLLDAVDVPINPMHSGRPYPNAEDAWGHDRSSCLLTTDEVRQVSHFLEKTPFSEVAVHLKDATKVQLYPMNRQWNSELMFDRVKVSYDEMVELFREAARNGECIVYFAA